MAECLVKILKKALKKKRKNKTKQKAELALAELACFVSLVLP